METSIGTIIPNIASINTVIVKVASPCNLNCTYCYVYNHEDKSYLSRPKFISEETFNLTIERIRSYCVNNEIKNFSIVFHGGEPTLLNLNTFKKFTNHAVDQLKGIQLTFSIQTNATLLDEYWINFFIEYNIGVGISLDGDKLINDSARVYHSGKGSYDHTIKGIKLLQKFNIEPHILCVINPQYSGIDVYKHFLSLGIKSMDFLIPDASHDSKLLLYGQFGNTPISQYLIPIFEKWFNDDDSSISIRIFEGLIKRILGGSMDTDTFGNPLMNYLIIESDGSIEILDALRVCEDKIGKSNLNVINSGFIDLYHEDSLVGKMLTSGISLCKACQNCEIVSICGGGYLPHRFSKNKRFDNPSIWCEDIKKLVAHIQSIIYQNGSTQI